MVHSVSAAVFVDHIITASVYAGHVVPPQVSLLLRKQVLPQALLPQIFINDFGSRDFVVAGLYSAVLTSAVAIFFRIGLVAVLALPENIVWRKINVLFG